VGYHQQQAAAQRVDAELAQAEAALADEDFGFGNQPQEAPEQIEEIDEIDDFEILDEEDADQADLVVADVGPPRRSHTEDFVNRLELSNTHDAAPAPVDDGDPLAGFRDREDSAISYGDARAYEIQQPAYTDPLAGFADDPSSAERSPYVQHARVHHVPHTAAPPQQPIWDPATGQYVYPNPYPDHDQHLESALEALDPDLDDLGQPIIDVPQPDPRNTIDIPTNQRRAAVNKRAMSEDDGGILIDFDDDDE
jgi:hypothetical protein